MGKHLFLLEDVISVLHGQNISQQETGLLILIAFLLNPSLPPSPRTTLSDLIQKASPLLQPQFPPYFKKATVPPQFVDAVHKAAWLQDKSRRFGRYVEVTPV